MNIGVFVSQAEARGWGGCCYGLDSRLKREMGVGLGVVLGSDRVDRGTCAGSRLREGEDFGQIRECGS